MKITEVKAFPMSHPYPGPFVRLGTGTAIKLDVVIVRIRTEDGILGYGEAHHALAPTVIAAATNPFKGEVVRPSPPVGSDGFVEPNDLPGLGVEVDESLFEKYPVIPGACYI